jgi:hypothetical protein
MRPNRCCRVSAQRLAEPPPERLVFRVIEPCDGLIESIQLTLHQTILPFALNRGEALRVGPNNSSSISQTCAAMHVARAYLRVGRLRQIDYLR